MIICLEVAWLAIGKLYLLFRKQLADAIVKLDNCHAVLTADIAKRRGDATTELMELNVMNLFLYFTHTYR